MDNKVLDPIYQLWEILKPNLFEIIKTPIDIILIGILAVFVILKVKPIIAKIIVKRKHKKEKQHL